MTRVITWWTNNSVAANLLMFGILLAGTLGFFAMEREVFPTFNANQVNLDFSWPGAAPQEVEEQILIRVEEALTDLDNVYRVYSTAEAGQGRLQVATYPGIDIDAFVNDVKMIVDGVSSLPRDMEQIRIRRAVQRNEIFRVVVHGQLGERTLKRLAEEMRSEVAALPFVSIVELFGTRREEVTIELSEEALHRYALTFAEVSNAIRNSSVNLSTGRVRTDTGDVLLRVRNMADTQDEFERIIIRQTEDGAMVRVGDVARVIDGFEDDEILATLNGDPAVLLEIMATDNMQVVKASDAVRSWMAEKQLTLPPGVNLSIWFDSADTYKSRMNTISSSAILGLALVFLVLILSLRPKVALWVTAGIAVAFIGTFAVLPG
jgi:multidrug efflux pump subunit AcrB